MTKARIVPLALVTMAALSVALAPATSAKGRPLNTAMIGADEVPVAGDPDGTGTARLRLNQGQRRSASRSRSPTSPSPRPRRTSIRAPRASPTRPWSTSGLPDATGLASGCTTGVARSLIKAIRKHPGDYYVNVHNDDFPDGAIRGQLAKGH